MKTVLKSTWRNKRVAISIQEYYLLDGFRRSFEMRIKVDDTHLLPASFCKGTTHKANQDIVETLGGLPNYVAKILNDAARREKKRRETPVKEQLSLF